MVFQLLTKQRQFLEEKFAQANQEMQLVLHQKADLEERLVTKEAIEKMERARTKEIEKVGSFMMYVTVITFYSPSYLGQMTAKRAFGLRVNLPICLPHTV